MRSNYNTNNAFYQLLFNHETRGPISTHQHAHIRDSPANIQQHKAQRHGTHSALPGSGPIHNITVTTSVWQVIHPARMKCNHEKRVLQSICSLTNQRRRAARRGLLTLCALEYVTEPSLYINVHFLYSKKTWDLPESLRR